MTNNWFQSIECYNFYSNLFFLEPFKFEVKRGEEVKGKIVGYIQKDGGKIKQFFSRRAIINGGPMLAEDITSDELESLLNECRKSLMGKAIYVESRNFEDYSWVRATLERNGWRYEPHYDIKICCTDRDSVERNIGKHRRRYIRLSVNNGATIVNTPNLEQVKEFYTILQELYKTKVKTSLWPFEFFEKLFYSQFGKYILIEFDGKIIGGSACVVSHEDNVLYEWFACGNDNTIKNIHPSSLVKYGGICYCFDYQIRTFDMMGAGAPGDGGYGVRDFKQEFGGELVEYGRFKCILNKPLYMMGRIGVVLLKKIK